MIYKFDYQYFGSTNYYFELINLTNYELELYDAYEKMSFRNRCRILGSNGPIDLSIPVVGGREIRIPMNEVQICYKEDWRSRHFKTLVSCYNRSPWFQDYSPAFESLYAEKIKYLYEWDFRCHMIVMENLKIELNKISISKPAVIDYEEKSNSPKEVQGKFQGKFLPRQPNPFNLKLKPYPQVFSDRFGFVPDLSILDLLFCEGPGALDVLLSADRKA